jgi:hypothetical protein
MSETTFFQSGNSQATEVLPDGTVRYISCFAAGTLVHTADGLVPIENIRVGTQVLSQPEDGGERALRRVVNKVSHLDQPLMAVQIHIEGEKGSELTTIFATPNHPFWVETPLVKDEEGGEPKHWLAAECLEPCMTLQLADGRSAEVRSAAIVRRTQYEDIFFAGDERVDLAQVLCQKDGKLEVATSERLAQLGKLELGDRYLTPVYNFEVEEFHTYYVGDAGIWVHNTNCSVAESLAAIRKKQDLESVCFPSDTPVVRDNGTFTKIQHLTVGSVVMSRCEKTGAVAPKRVIKVYENSAQYYAIFCNYGPAHTADFGHTSPYVYATGDHPFWVEGKGWTPVKDLKAGDAFLTLNDDPTTVEYVLTPEEFAKRIDPSFVAHAAPVYNLEVEDFNTYFVDTGRIWVHNCNNIKPDVQLLNPRAVTEPRPEWSSFHRSTEQLQRAYDGIEPIDLGRGNLSPEDIRVKIIEAQSDLALNKAGIRTVGLPAEAELVARRYESNIGKYDSSGEQLGYADRLLFSDRYPDLNGVAADIYTPKGNSTTTAAQEIIKKSQRQSSVVVLDLRYSESGITLEGVVKTIDTGFDSSGPPKGLRTLLVIDKNGDVVRINYPKTPLNQYIYGSVTITETGLIAIRLPGRPAAGTELVVRNYSPASAQNAQFLLTNSQDDRAADQLNAADAQRSFAAAREFWLAAGASAIALNRIQVSIGNLPQAVAAQAMGTQITLSADGAGWGWFVDTTPAVQEEFSAGFTTDVFLALAGSTAEGKLDLLTVLIHEMGHALGLDHASESHDVMAAVLTPGERRLLDDDMAADLRAAGQYVAPDRLSITRVTSPDRTGRPTSTPQFAVIANPSLINGDFGPDATTGWVVGNTVALSRRWHTDGTTRRGVRRQKMAGVYTGRISSDQELQHV